MENYIIKRTLKRFGRDVVCLEKTLDGKSVGFQFVDEEKYCAFFEKMDAVFNSFLKSEAKGRLEAVITFLEGDKISLACRVKTDEEEVFIPINFDIKTNTFENGFKVLKSAGIGRRDTFRTVGRACRKFKLLDSFALRIKNGVAVYFKDKNEQGETLCVKIRRDIGKN